MVTGLAASVPLSDEESSIVSGGSILIVFKGVSSEDVCALAVTTGVVSGWLSDSCQVPTSCSRTNAVGGGPSCGCSLTSDRLSGILKTGLINLVIAEGMG